MDNFAGPVAAAAQREKRAAELGPLSRFRRQPPPGVQDARRSCSSRASSRRIAASLDLHDGGLHVRQRAAGAPLRHPGHPRQPLPARDADRRTRASGLLGKGSVLAVTSHAERTSPVVRGKWILDNILGAPVPPPPPDVPQLKEKGEGEKPRTMREQMAEHRTNPVCATCHKVMDPIGLVPGELRRRGRLARRRRGRTRLTRRESSATGRKWTASSRCARR